MNKQQSWIIHQTKYNIHDSSPKIHQQEKKILNQILKNMTKNVQTMQKLNQKCFYKKHVNTRLTRIRYRRLASSFFNSPPPPPPPTLPWPWTQASVKITTHTINLSASTNTIIMQKLKLSPSILQKLQHNILVKARTFQPTCHNSSAVSLRDLKCTVSTHQMRR